MNVVRECIKPGTIIESALEIDSTVFKYDINTVIFAIKAFYDNQNNCFLSKYPFVASDRMSANLIYIGGGSGFVSKTAVYSLFKNRNKAVELTGKILDNLDKAKVGKHYLDYEKYNVSPHTRKCTVYDSIQYDFGLCKIDFQPMAD